MTERYDHGPLETYEVIWKSGHVERIQAHQVTHPNNATGGFFGGPAKPSIMEFHGEFDGRWRLILRVHEEDLHTVRNLSRTEAETI